MSWTSYIYMVRASREPMTGPATELGVNDSCIYELTAVYGVESRHCLPFCYSIGALHSPNQGRPSTP